MKDDAVFLGTSGWIALLNTDDQLHKPAVQAWRGLASRRTVIAVTDWVIAETGNGLSRTSRRDAFARAVQLIPTTEEFRLVIIDDILLMRAVQFYQARPDQEWGLVDCASFVVMTDLGIRDALTADRHYEQAGFRCLLK